MRWALLLPLLLVDCGGSAPDTGAPPTDEMLQRQTHAGQLAFELERNARIELERRGAKPFPALLLAEATALYRTGAAAEADRAAQRIQQSEDADAVARATFLRGLIADDRGDEAGLATAADALTTAKTPPFEADSAELSARLALRRGDPARAREQAAHAAGLRQATLDYRGRAPWPSKE